MDETAVVAVAEAETERQEDASDTAVELAEISADVAKAKAEAACDIAETNADAAVAIAEAEAEGIDETWLNSKFDGLAAVISANTTEMARMADAMTTLAMSLAPAPSIPIAPSETVTEAEAEVIEATAEATAETVAETPPADAEDRQEAKTRNRVRRWM